MGLKPPSLKRSCHVEQSILVIGIASRHLRSPSTQTGKMVRIALSWAQAYASVSWSLWEFPGRPIPAIPTPWIVGVSKALASMQAKIMQEDKCIPPKLRAQDWYIIMEKAMDLGEFSNQEIDDINACHRYYQAITAADITDDKGTKI